MTEWIEFATAIAAPGDLEPAFEALWQLTDHEIGAPLFTVMTFDQDTRLSTRIWSSMPEAYPPQGTKPLPESDWADLVLGQQKPFVANSIEEIAGHFADHELIQSLGCESCLNLPVVYGGRVLGTLNCLDVAGHYTPERVAHAARLVAPGALCLLRLSEVGRLGEEPVQ